MLKAMYRYLTKGETANFAKNDRLTVFWYDVVNWLDTNTENYAEKVKQASAAGKESAKNRKKEKVIGKPGQNCDISYQKENKPVESNVEYSEAEEEEAVKYFKRIFEEYTERDIGVIKRLYMRYGLQKVKNGILAGKKFEANTAYYVEKMLNNAKDGNLDMDKLAQEYSKKYNSNPKRSILRDLIPNYVNSRINQKISEKPTIRVVGFFVASYIKSSRNFTKKARK